MKFGNKIKPNRSQISNAKSIRTEVSLCQMRQRFQPRQDLTMHRTKVHSGRKMKNVTKKQTPDTANSGFSKSDLIAIIKVKINALQDVVVMLENL